MDANNTNPLYIDPQQQVYNPLGFNQGKLSTSDPLSLDIPDDDLVDIVDKRIEASEKFFEERYNLRQRREKNELYLFGRQTGIKEKEGKLKDYETRSSDNALYEIEASLKPLALSKLPDIIVTPGSEDPVRQESAKDLSMAIDDMNKKRHQREVLGLGFKHLPVYFTAVIKARWDSEIGDQGDFIYENINPAYVVVDHTAVTKNVDDMSYVAQVVPMTVQELLMKFPSKEKEIYKQLQKAGLMVGETPTWKELASEVKIYEVWYDWYQKKGSKADGMIAEVQTTTEFKESIFEPGIKWEKVSGVLWKYDKLLLQNMLDPNFDHKGEEKVFIYTTPGDETTKQEVTPEMMMMSAMTGQPLPGLTKEQIYHNYFTRPHKPYYFFGYDQWGKIAYDETSRIEQNIRNQENLDDQNKTILDQIKTRVKHIWSADSGLRKADIQRLDMDDPKIDVRVEGNPNEVHAQVNPERPDAAQFGALSDTRSRMYAISGATAIRGQLQSNVATSNQIAREADFTRSDDLVEDTINSAAEWMAQWQMQFIKLRYTDDHLREILGAKGQMLYVRLRRDSIYDGMEVMIKASSTDKLKASRNAMEVAALPGYSDPVSLYEDTGMSDPEGRAEKAFLYQNDPATYFTKFILHLDNTQQQIGALAGAIPGVGAPAQGAPAGAPQNPTPTNTSAVATEAPPLAAGSPRAL